MATNKIITVTVIPTLSGDTIASYNAYSDIDGLLGAMTPAEGLAGKIFALSNGATHDITVKAVWTTAGETTTVGSNVVVVDLPITSMAINFIEANNEYLQAPIKTLAIGGSIKLKSNWVGTLIQSDYFYGNNQSIAGNGGIGIRLRTFTSIDFIIGDSTGAVTSPSVDIVSGDEIELKYSAVDTFEVYKNGILSLTINLTGFTPLSRNDIFGALLNTPTNISDGAIIWGIEIDGETFAMSEGSGATIIGSSGTIITVNSDVSVDAMWVAIP